MSTNTAQKGSLLEAASLGKIPPRSMGLPVVVSNRGLGASTTVYADLFDLVALGYKDRIFTGISIYNPDASNAINIAMGAAFVQASGNCLYIPKASTLTIDNLTYGPGIVDVYTQTKCTNIRAALSATSGTAASGTVTFSTNPTDGMQVTLGVNIYDFVSNRNAADGNIQVQLGTTLALTLTALKNAINATDQNVTASASTTVLTLTSNYSGTYGNSYATVDGGVSGVNPTGATFAAGTLASGANGTTPVCHLW